MVSVTRPLVRSLQVNNLGVLLTATALVAEMCQQNTQALQVFRKVRALILGHFHRPASLSNS